MTAATTSPSPEHGAPRSWGTIPPIDITATGFQEDYSIGRLFSQHHAEFLQNERRFRPDLQVFYRHQFETTVKEEPGDFTFDEVRFDGDLRLPTDPDGFVQFGASVGTLQYDFSPTVQGPDDPNEDFNEVSVRVGVGRFLHDDLLVTAVFEPGVYADYHGTLKREAWEFFGEALLSFRAQESLFLKAGVEVSKDFEDLPVFPLIGASWMFLPQWRIDVLLPREIELSFNPSAELIFAAGLELEGNQYAIYSPQQVGKQMFSAEMQEMRLYGEARLRMTDQLSVFGRIGTTVAGDYEIRGSTGIYDGTLEPGLFLVGGVGWNF